jgi:hypothetical protein
MPSRMPCCAKTYRQPAHPESDLRKRKRSQQCTPRIVRHRAMSELPSEFINLPLDLTANAVFTTPTAQISDLFSSWTGNDTTCPNRSQTTPDFPDVSLNIDWAVQPTNTPCPNKSQTTPLLPDADVTSDWADAVVQPSSTPCLTKTQTKPLLLDVDIIPDWADAAVQPNNTSCLNKSQTTPLLPDVNLDLDWADAVI